MARNKQIYIVGGGTVNYITSHLALSAPSYGTTAKYLAERCRKLFPHMDVNLVLTKMADPHSPYETVEDLRNLREKITNDPEAKIVIWNPAVCDFLPTNLFQNMKYTAEEVDLSSKIGKYSYRIESPEGDIAVQAKQNSKILPLFRQLPTGRKDLFVVGFKTTCGASQDQQFSKAIRSLKASSVNLVLANDVKTHHNIIVAPEEGVYAPNNGDRKATLDFLLDMVKERSNLTFTRSTVVDAKRVRWDSELIPDSLRKVVNWCVAEGAYKKINGYTAGHFAVSLGKVPGSETQHQFLTSIRKSNFNLIKQTGLVLVKTDGKDTVLAYGAVPSVGGQSQVKAFIDHPGFDCIVHFHCPLQTIVGEEVPTISQWQYECGSHQCGKNASSGLKEFLGGKIKAVHLDQHGGFVMFNKSTDPETVIGFINNKWNLKEIACGLTYEQLP